MKIKILVPLSDVIGCMSDTWNADFDTNSKRWNRDLRGKIFDGNFTTDPDGLRICHAAYKCGSPDFVETSSGVFLCIHMLDLDATGMDLEGCSIVGDALNE